MAPRSPWQHPYVERVIGRMRCECLDHVVILHEHHLRHILTAYCASDQRCRTPLSLAMDYPEPRPSQAANGGRVMTVPEVGGRHPHYERVAVSP